MEFILIHYFSGVDVTTDKPVEKTSDMLIAKDDISAIEPARGGRACKITLKTTGKSVVANAPFTEALMRFNFFEMGERRGTNHG